MFLFFFFLYVSFSCPLLVSPPPPAPLGTAERRGKGVRPRSDGSHRRHHLSAGVKKKKKYVVVIVHRVYRNADRKLTIPPPLPPRYTSLSLFILIRFFLFFSCTLVLCYTTGLYSRRPRRTRETAPRTHLHALAS